MPPSFSPHGENVVLEIDSNLDINIDDNVITISEPVEEPNDEGIEESNEEEQKDSNVNSNEVTNEEGNKNGEDEEIVEDETIEEPVQESEEEPVESEPTEEVAANWQNFEFTHYTATCEGCTGITSTGVDVTNTTHYNGMRVVAVNPNVIPYDTVLEIKYPDGSTEMAIAKDTGGAIRARTDLIDILVSNQSEALTKGRMNGQIRIVE
ncbi:3D domain-containing protein [Alkalicoccobacillus gibsonii]|uniref:3D domain-containing protein n=1 Tax=Alkalicoccobacillus gibsonii TaxID=79881 RepID=UPI0035183390